MPFRWIGCFGLLMLLGPAAGATQDSPPPSAIELSFTADQLLDLADASEAQGDSAMAKAILQALTEDPAIEVRSEARFRLGQMAAATGDLAAAADCYRQILAEVPSAQRVRLELARVLDLMGQGAEARQLLREAQAAGLPPEVARFVDRYAAVLRARKPVGLSFDVALVADSNINRATRSETLGTIIGDFILDADARERAGVGLSLAGQAFGRLSVADGIDLLARAGGDGDFYRPKGFDGGSARLSVGPEVAFGRHRLSLEAGVDWRWHGGPLYRRTASLAATWIAPLGERAQIRTSASAATIDNARQPGLDGKGYIVSASVERALSETAGIGGALTAEREALADAGSSTWGGQATLYGYRDIGGVTVIASVGHGRLAADRRQFLYPEKRRDSLWRASMVASFHRVDIGGFSPLLRLTAERNHSSIELYDFRRLRAELGLSRAF